MENEKLLSIRNDLVENFKQALKESLEELIRDENSSEAYYSLQIELGRMWAYQGILIRHFNDSDLVVTFNEIKNEMLIVAKEYCEDYGYELTQEHLECLDSWLTP